MALYTLNLDFGGGNYTAQREAPDPVTAFYKWIRCNPCPRGITKEEWKALKKGFQESPPVTLKRVKNVWCLFSNARRKCAILNIIKTESR